MTHIIEEICLYLSYNECMKKTTKRLIPTPTIEELQKRCELLEKQKADLEAKLERKNLN